jgi:hypothetical protein
MALQLLQRRKRLQRQLQLLRKLPQQKRHPQQTLNNHLLYTKLEERLTS